MSQNPLPEAFTKFLLFLLFRKTNKVVFVFLGCEIWRQLVMKDEKKSLKESSRCLERWPELRGRGQGGHGGQFPGAVSTFENSEWGAPG